MLGKTNIIYVTKDQNSEMQFVKEYIQTKSTSDFSDIKYYNGIFFALEYSSKGEKVRILYGSDIEKLEYLKYNDAMLEITNVQFFDGNYIFFDRDKEFEYDKNSATITLEYYAGSNLSQLEKKCLSYDLSDTNETTVRCGKIIDAEISSDNKLVFLILVYRGKWQTKENTNFWYVMNIRSDLNTVQEEIVTEEKYNKLGINSSICFMRDRFYGLNYNTSAYSESYMLSLDGILTGVSDFVIPSAILNEIAYYIVDRAIYYSTNFTSKVLIRPKPADNYSEPYPIGIFSIGGRIAFKYYVVYDEYKLLLADSFNDIRDNMTSLDVGNFCDYSVRGWVEVGGCTYFAGPSGIIVKCLLDTEGSYQLPEVTLIKTLAARQALDQAKQYTDEKVAELKNYIDSLNESSI